MNPSFVRLLTLLVFCASASGCSTRVDNFIELAAEAFDEPTDIVFDQKQIDNMRYAAVYLKTESTPQVVAVLTRISGGDLTPQRNWSTGGREVITTQHGRIVSAAGVESFPRYLSNTHRDPLLCLVDQHRAQQALHDCAMTWQWQFEFAGHGTHEASRIDMRSDFVIESTNQTYIHPDGTPLAATVIREVVTVQTADSFDIEIYENRYLLSNGRVVKAHQWVSPQLGYATITELKPFSGDLLP